MAHDNVCASTILQIGIIHKIQDGYRYYFLVISLIDHIIQDFWAFQAYITLNIFSRDENINFVIV